MATEKKTGLLDLLVRRIDALGPLTVADYMRDCLMHPAHGYYTQEKVFGAEGDFITAPEVSQMFGEMIGLWCVDRWDAMGRPPAFQLIELGPGRGTLMADILRATKNLPGFHKAATVTFVELSEKLRTLQKEKVPNARWVADLASLGEGPALFIANEFFDALPIHQFVAASGAWRERAVTHQDGRLTWCLIPPGPALSLIPSDISPAKDGTIVEVCPAALSVAGHIADHLATHAGAALVIDYGYTKSMPGDSFQALKHHEYSDPLDGPGSADLTAHVNFAPLKAAAEGRGVFTYGPAAQGDFLMHLGIGYRAQSLAANKSEAEQEKILLDLRRLTGAEEMGQLFKVLALQSVGLSAPPGFPSG